MDLNHNENQCNCNQDVNQDNSHSYEYNCNQYMEINPTSSTSEQWNRLPLEATSFGIFRQRFTGFRVWSYMVSRRGNVANSCTTPRNDRPMMILGDYNNANAHHQQFIFFPTDSNEVILSSRYNGDVMTNSWASVSRYDILGRPWSGNRNQLWRRTNVAGSHFALVAINLNRAIDVCHNLHHNNALLTLANSTNVNDQNLQHQRVRTVRHLTRPETAPLMTGSPMIPQFTNPNNLPPAESERFLKGVSLIPCIMVSDTIPMSTRMAESPYYILERWESWIRLWSRLGLPPGSTYTTSQVTGVTSNTQQTLERHINFNISSDLSLNFLPMLSPLKFSVAGGLKQTISRSDTLATTETNTLNIPNPSAHNLSIAGYGYTETYVLKRANGVSVMNNQRVIRSALVILTFPHNTPVDIQTKLIQGNYAYNNSDLCNIKYVTNNKTVK